MGDIYDYIEQQKTEGRWYSQMPDSHRRTIEEMKDKIRRLENRVKYWKRRAYDNEN